MGRTIGITAKLKENLVSKFTEQKKALEANIAELQKFIKNVKNSEQEIEEAKKALNEKNTALKNVKSTITNVAKSCIKMESGLKMMKKGCDMVTKGANNVEKHIRAMAAPLSIFGLSLGAIGLNALKTARDFEQYRVSFEVLLGSQARAKALMEEITVYAAKTPFEMPELVDGTRRLLAFGIGVKEVVPLLGRLGDLSMGNKDKLERMTDAFGKVKARGKANMRDLNRFIEAGVPIVAQLAKNHQTSAAAIMEMTEKGRIGYKDVEQAIVSLTSAGGQFEGMTIKQGQTLQGVWSTLTDSWNIATAQLADGFLPKIKELVRTINEKIPAIIEFIKPYVDTGIGLITYIVDNLDQIALAIVGVVKAFLLFQIIGAICGVLQMVWGVIQIGAGAVTFLSGAFTLLSAATSPITATVIAVALAVAALAAIVIICVKNWDKIVAVIKTAIDLIKVFLGITPKELKVRHKHEQAPAVDGSHAGGLDYVPFDGYIAELHRGERVLTQSENNVYNNRTVTGGASVVLNLNIAGNMIGNAEFLNTIKRELGSELMIALARA